MINNYKWTLRLTLLTPPLLFIAILFMGGGHGWFEPAMLLFPFGMVGTIILLRFLYHLLF
ncbi:MAG TPA: hypothetical protein VF622_19615 [Segetibacter sp.]